MNPKRYFYALSALIIPLILLAWALPTLALGNTQPEGQNEPQPVSQNDLGIKDPSDYATIVYINPSSTTPGDGSSPDTPLLAWRQVSFQADTAYVQKRGTIDFVTSAIIVGPDNVLLGAYGDMADPRPKVIDVSDSIRYMVQVAGDAVTVRDLEIVSPRATSGIHFAAGYWPSDGVAYNNYVHGVDQSNYLMWGIRVFGDRTRVLSNTIKYIGDDGIFVQYFADIEIAYNHVTRVNQKWFEDPSEEHAGGDGIQFDTTDRFHIHHNFVDRSDTGNKFCIIVDPKGEDVTGGLIEFNQCRMTTTMWGLFAGGASDYRVVIRNNVFEYVGSDRQQIGVYSHSPHPEIYNNIFIGLDQGINLWNSSADAKVHHNTFYHIDTAGVRGSVASLEAHNNLFALDDGATALSLGNVIASHNLFVHADQATGDHPVVGDPGFVDASAHDFHLLPQSDAVDAGTSLAAIPTDAEGNLRYGDPDIGVYELQPALILSAAPADQTINLKWIVNLTLPATTTWTISYEGPAGDQPSPITDISGELRSYSLTGLTNYEWYTITLSTDPPMLSDSLRIMPTDLLVYLPVIVR